MPSRSFSTKALEAKFEGGKFTSKQKGLPLMLKRALDLVGASLGLLFLSPLFLLISILIKLDSSGPAIFKQKRVGKNGHIFTFYKFRSMYVSGDEEIHRSYVTNLIRGEARKMARKVGAKKVFKLADDPRVTRVGRFLRRTSLDELPQLFNVLKGEMSLVGPRPPIPYEVELYEDWQMKRLSVLPGITGYWQVEGRANKDYNEMVKMDLQYIKNWSLWLDLKILSKTIKVVLSREGAW
jgi:exopolysaccharide biosynthesis polyprenyl glycosylphosphotransferase